MKARKYFNIETIIDLIREQEPDRIDLIEQLEQFEQKVWQLQGYVRFLSRDERYDECFELEDDSIGTMVVDLFEDGKIGGIEFHSYIPYY